MNRILNSTIGLIALIVIASILAGGAFVALSLSAGESLADSLLIGAVVVAFANGVAGAVAYGGR